MDDELVEAIAPVFRRWGVRVGSITAAEDALAAVREAGFSIVSTEDWETARALVDPDGDWE